MEHLSYFLSSGYSFVQQRTICNKTSTINFDEFMFTNYNYIMNVIPYTMVTGILILVSICIPIPIPIPSKAITITKQPLLTFCHLKTRLSLFTPSDSQFHIHLYLELYGFICCDGQSRDRLQI